MGERRVRRGPPPERDRQAMRAGHARRAEAETPRGGEMPGWCQTCGTRVFLFLWPQIYWGDRFGRRHACEWSEAGRDRLEEIATVQAVNAAAAANRRARRVTP